MSTDATSHVKDADFFHLPNGTEEGWIVEIPQPFEAIGIPLHVTKFMILELVAALLIIAIFVPLARRIITGERPRGKFWNFFEAILMFLRDQVARPVIGKADADRYLPYIWTVFFFILFCNLLGMIPWCGSPTGAWACTLVLAVASLVIVFGTGMRKYGPIGYFLSLMPHMDLPFAMKIIIIPLMGPMIVAIEVLGVLIKHFVLSVRLLANMFAGHLVLATIVGFLGATAGTSLWYGVLPASLLGAVALSMLELFVAFLQAYIFTFLSALFIGMALHPH